MKVGPKMDNGEYEETQEFDKDFAIQELKLGDDKRLNICFN